MVNSPPEPPQRPDRKRAAASVVAIITIVAVIVVIVRLANAQSSSENRPSPRDSPPLSSPSGEADLDEGQVVGAEPDAWLGGRCEVGYDENFDQDHHYYNRALATISVMNTGNVGITGEIWLEFPQEDSELIEFSTLIDLHIGEATEVHIDEPISSDQVDRFEESDRQCEYRIEILDIFGDVAD